jgi:ABC-2 type transport system ATP-binding protein
VEAVRINDLTKRYGQVQAVDDLSFEVRQGEIFGLLGPNGAGKTSTIRMIMDIIKPDSGSILFMGQPPSARMMERIGYMPEERGLYPDLTLLECLVYLAELKGMPRAKARARALDLLRRVELDRHYGQKVKALSKGMQQKVQFLVTLMHDPQLVILDEPFQGLDPVNTELIKGMIVTLRQQGTAVIMSSHMMNQVEQMCDRILLVDHGRAKLYGPLHEIKARYGRRTLLVELGNSEDFPADLPGVARVDRQGNQYEVLLLENTTPPAVLQQLLSRTHSITRFEVGNMPLDQIFISVVGHSGQEPLQ